MILFQPVPQLPAPPALPSAPPGVAAPVGVRVVVPGQLIGQDLASLRSRRSELSSQLQSATSRRNQLAREMRGSLPNTADRAGLESRLQLLDQRIIQLEGDLAETGRLLALAPAQATTSQPVRGPRRDPRQSRDFGPLAMIMAFMLVVPFAWGAARSLFRRPLRPVAPVADEESRERLARLEMAVDAIAIEVERVAEGQRFVTRLLSEPAVAQAIAAGGAAARHEAARAVGEPFPR